MRISCPCCQTEYLVKGEHVGAEGRRVRCGRCQYSWRHVPEEHQDENPIERLQAELMATFMLSAFTRGNMETVE